MVLKRRCVRSLNILGPNGEVPASLQESADNLYHHWTNVFAAKPVCLKLADVSLGQSIQQVPPGIRWERAWEDLQDIVKARRDTGSGVDGIVYGYYGAIPEAWLQKLYDVYLHLFEGGCAEPSFNHSKIVMLPKGKQKDDTPTSVTRVPSKVRPLNLSNTDKHVPSLACLPICEVANARWLFSRRVGWQGVASPSTS